MGLYTAKENLVFDVIESPGAPRSDRALGFIGRGYELIVSCLRSSGTGEK
jgi:hypothetical protein